MADKLPPMWVLFRFGPMQVLQIVGDSMIEAGIASGDFAIIEEARPCVSGDIAVVRVTQRYIKRVYFHPGCVELRPANRSMTPLFVYPPDSVEVIGRVEEIVRRYE